MSIVGFSLSNSDKNQITGNMVKVTGAAASEAVVGSQYEFDAPEIKTLMDNMKLQADVPTAARKNNDGSVYNGPVYTTSYNGITYYIKFPDTNSNGIIQIMQQGHEDRYRDLTESDFWGDDAITPTTNIYSTETWGEYSYSLNKYTFTDTKANADNSFLQSKEKAAQDMGIDTSSLTPEDRKSIGLSITIIEQPKPSFFSDIELSNARTILAKQAAAKAPAAAPVAAAPVVAPAPAAAQPFTVGDRVQNKEEGTLGTVIEISKYSGEPIVKWDDGSQSPALGTVTSALTKVSTAPPAVVTAPAAVTDQQKSDYLSQSTKYFNDAGAATDPAEQARLYGLAADYAAKAGYTEEEKSLRNFQAAAQLKAAVPTTSTNLDPYTSSLFGTAATEKPKTATLTYDDFIKSFNAAADKSKATSQQKTDALKQASTDFSSSNPSLSAQIDEQLAKLSKDPAEKVTYYTSAAEKWGLSNPTKQASDYADAFDAQIDVIDAKYGVVNGDTSKLSTDQLTARNDEINKAADDYSGKIADVPEITITSTADEIKAAQELEAARNRIKNGAYMNTPPTSVLGLPVSWFNAIQRLNKALTGYSGASFFYTDDGFFLKNADESINNLLGGIAGWTSELCKNDVTEDINSNSGYAFSQSTAGAYAHIEGEKITVTNYTNPSSPTSIYYYKISFEVSPGTTSVGCDLKFRTYLGQGTTPLVVDNTSNTAYQFDISRGDDATSYTGTSMIVKQSTNEYTQACILFDEIAPRAGGEGCLIGITEGDYLCSTITAGAEQQFTDFECDYCFILNKKDNSSSGAGSASGNQGSAAVNPNI